MENKKFADYQINYFNPREPVANLSGNLPHWRQEGVAYFVTFRLADSIPSSKLNQLMLKKAEWLKIHPEPHDKKTKAEYYSLFIERSQKWLDKGYGACILKDFKIRTIVIDIIKYHDGVRYILDNWVIMPNHVHIIITPNEVFSLSEIEQYWKSLSAHKINKAIKRKGILWQKESFDHIIRNPIQL